MKMSIARKVAKKNGGTPLAVQPKVLTKVRDGSRPLPVVGAVLEAQKNDALTHELHCAHVKLTWENVTPIKAEAMLNSNNINRKLRPGVYEKYAADMIAGKWTTCTTPIAIYDNGNVADGQHRLWAIVDSGKSQWMIIARGLRQPEGLNLDTGCSRNVVDAARISGIDPHMSTNLYSAARSIETGQPNHTAISNAEKIRLVDKHRAAAHFAVNHVYGKKIGNGPTYGAIGRAFYHVQDKAKLERFCHVLRTGQSEGMHESAAVTLRNYLLASNANVSTTGLYRDTFLRAQRAIKVFVSGKQLLSLRAVTDEEYPLPTPTKAKK